jgi:hypothetical protein
MEDTDSLPLWDIGISPLGIVQELLAGDLAGRDGVDDDIFKQPEALARG